MSALLRQPTVCRYSQFILLVSVPLHKFKGNCEAHLRRTAFNILSEVEFQILKRVSKRMK
jgi:hypothetical protein